MEASSLPYKPLAQRCWLAQRWIGITALFAVTMLGMNAAYLAAFGQPEEAAALKGMVGVWYLVQICLDVLAAGTFLAWFLRAYSNARTLGAARPDWQLLRVWCAAWLLTSAVAAVRIDQRTLDPTRHDAIVAIVAESLYVVAAILCIVVTRRLTAQQDANASSSMAVSAPASS